MIHQLQNSSPYITFGFGQTVKTIAVGSPVTVWLNTLYNEQEYTFSLLAQADVTKVSAYQYSIVATRTGVIDISLIVSAKHRKISLQSNVLTLNIE